MLRCGGFLILLMMLMFSWCGGEHGLFAATNESQAAMSLPLGKPNVIFIAIDDQNDWIAAMGHPFAQTPHLDALAKRGTIFLNAHCQAPLCNPSRTSVLLGLRPSTTGIHGLMPWFREVEELAGRVTLPQYFKAAGYRTLTAGKIFHQPAAGTKKRSQEFDVWGPNGGVGVKPAKKLIPATPLGDHPLMDWGCFDHKDENKGDYQIASWAIEQIQTAPKDKPYFLALGFFLPHVPCYATQRWFDLYPDDDRVLPALQKNDRKDTPKFSWYLHWSLPEPRLKWVQDNGQWRNLVRSYLACTSFVDAQIGRVMEALQNSGQEDNTLIVLWSDHGWHLGEKEITGKNTLWERSTRVPLIFAGPGVTKEGRCLRPVELLDVYPTLIDLAGLPSRDDLEGQSLLPLLRNHQAPRERPAITTHNQGNHAVRSERWRFIRYADGSEELYDMQIDPHEWGNLANQMEHREVLEWHRRWLPKKDLPAVKGSAHRVLTYDANTGHAAWEGRLIAKDDEVPQ